MSDEGPYGPLLETRLRVLTWNLWWRFGPWERRRPAIAATLAELRPDVVALQEVWGEPGGTNLAAELGAELGYEHAYAFRLSLDGVDFGNAVLSRWPITSSTATDLPAPPDADELRLMLRADVDGPRGRFQVFSTHLNWRFDHSAVRQEQVRTIAEAVAAARPRTFPPVLCGDFNAVPDSDEVRMLTGRAAGPVDGLVFHDAWEVAGDGGPGPTWSNANPYAALDLEPDRRIDYVLTGWPKAGGAGHVTSCRVVGTEPVDGVVPSDHYGVLAELRY
ncbi:MAG TPA: endonuclease/exonuclease/phosphatase family protein [Acidimicrobiales bacterium]|nr:endonuclease/exonuclease/phosphatase family protein [Acidimicrobiales bacterium]